MNAKTIVFSVVAFLISIVVLDAGLQITYVVLKHRATWQVSEDFRVRDFTYRVNDERYISAIPNYEGQVEGSTLTTNSDGFRSGKYKTSTVANIVFIGDSVPFGWGVSADDSVPSKLHEILLIEGFDVGIVNAAIPSYSLDQAVHRYKYEIAKTLPVSVIILQIYDPVSQFANFGEQWVTSLNWTTRRNYDGIRFSKVPRWLQYSSLGYLYWRFIHSRNRNIVLTAGAVDYYKNSITASLDVLLEQARVGGANILLLPVNIPKNSWTRLPENYRTAINELNSTLRLYSDNNIGVAHLDIIESFRSYDDELLFTDTCCHLTPKGGEIQAQQIYSKLVEIGF